MHFKNDHSLKVVTFRILAFLGGCVVALLKVVCSSPKNTIATGNDTTVHLDE